MPVSLYDKPISGEDYFTLPYEQLLRSGAIRQAQEDKTRAELVKVGNKTFNFLPGDRATALEDQKWLYDQTQAIYDKAQQSGKGLERRDVMNLQKEYQKRFDDFSLDKVREKRLNKFNTIQKNIEENPNTHPLQKEVYLKELLPQANESAEYNFSTGAYKDIKAPQEFQWKDVNTEIKKVLAEISEDSQYKNKYGKTPIDFITAYTEGIIKGKDRDKIAETLVLRLGPDKDLIKTSQVIADKYIPGNNIDESQFYTVVQDPKTKEKRIVFNTNTLLGQSMEGATRGASYTQENYNTNFITNQKELADYKTNLKAQQNQPQYQPPLSSNLERLGFGNEFKSPEDISKKKESIKLAQEDVVIRAKSLRDAEGKPVLSPVQIEFLLNAAKGEEVKLSNVPLNPEQRDAFAQYLNEIQQGKEILKRTKEYEQRARTANYLDENWEATPEAQKAGQEAFDEFIYNYSSDETPGTLESLRNNSEAMEGAEKARQKAMAESDPNYKKYLNWLETNASRNTELVGVSTLPSKNVENKIADILTQDLNKNGGTGVRDFKSRQPFEDIDAKLFDKIGKIESEGIRYYIEDGEVRLVTRPIIKGTGTKDTPEERMDYIDVKAPNNTLFYIMQGATDDVQRELIVKTFLDKAKKQGTATSVIGNTPLKIRALTATDIAATPNAEYSIQVGKTVKNMSFEEAMSTLVTLSKAKIKQTDNEETEEE